MVLVVVSDVLQCFLFESKDGVQLKAELPSRDGSGTGAGTALGGDGVRFLPITGRFTPLRKIEPVFSIASASKFIERNRVSSGHRSPLEQIQKAAVSLF